MHRSVIGSGARRARRRYALVAAAVLVVAACGSDDEPDAADATQPPTTQPTADTTAPMGPATSGSTEPSGTPAAADGISDELIAAAKEEGRLVLYTVLVPGDNDRLIAAFNDEYPEISITVDRKAPAQLAPQVEAEARTGTGIGDVYISSDTAWMRDHADLLVPLQSSWIDHEAYAPYIIGSRTGVVFQLVPYGIAWNTTSVPEGLSTWESLESLPDGLTLGTPDPRVAIGTGGWSIFAKEHLGEEFLCSVYGAGPNLYESGSAAAQALAAGEIDYIVPGHIVARELQREGAPVDVALPSPVITAVVSAGVLQTTPHPNAAQLFVDFLLSEKGQEAANLDKMSMLADIPGTLGDVTDSAEFIDMATVTPEAHEEFFEWFDGCAGR